jgi:hypothetical protein
MQSNKQFLVSLTLAAVILVVFGFVLYTVVAQSGLFSGGDDDALLAASSTENGDQESTSSLGDTYAGQSIVFSAVPLNAESDVTDTFLVDVYSNEVTKFIDYPTRSFALQTDIEEFAIAYVPESDDPDSWQPAWFEQSSDLLGILPNIAGYNESDLTVSVSNGLWYAYSYQTAPNLSVNDIADWNVALHDNTTGRTMIFSSTTEPLFINDGADLLLMQTDAIYSYNLESEEMTSYATEYTNLAHFIDYALSPGDDRLLMTLPTISLISIQSILDDSLVVSDDSSVVGMTVEVSAVFAAKEGYYYPVISPDGALYAVVMVSETDYDALTGLYDDATLQIRDIATNTLIKTIELPEVHPTTVVLEDWGTFVKR